MGELKEGAMGSALLAILFALGQTAGGPLQGLPGNPGPHAAALRDLGDNSWMELGAPAPDPVWGSAPGRSWHCTMPFASTVRGAFLYGEGVHGHVKPGGR